MRDIRISPGLSRKKHTGKEPPPSTTVHHSRQVRPKCDVWGQEMISTMVVTERTRRHEMILIEEKARSENPATALGATMSQSAFMTYNIVDGSRRQRRTW